VAELDLKRGLRAKRWFDVVGHYSRDDVFHVSTRGVDAESAQPPNPALGPES